MSPYDVMYKLGCGWAEVEHGRRWDKYLWVLANIPELNPRLPPNATIHPYRGIKPPRVP